MIDWSRKAGRFTGEPCVREEPRAADRDRSASNDQWTIVLLHATLFMLSFVMACCAAFVLHVATGQPMYPFLSGR